MFEIWQTFVQGWFPFGRRRACHPDSLATGIFCPPRMLLREPNPERLLISTPSYFQAMSVTRGRLHLEKLLWRLKRAGFDWSSNGVIFVGALVIFDVVSAFYFDPRVQK